MPQNRHCSIRLRISASGPVDVIAPFDVVAVADGLLFAAAAAAAAATTAAIADETDCAVSVVTVIEFDM